MALYMKKLIILSIILGLVLFVAAISFSIYLAFKEVKPTADAINRDIVRDIAGTVAVPKGIAPPSVDFNQTTYNWEMETTAKEVTPVSFSYTPAFSKNSNKIVATLSMPENGDPSIFNKVLEGIITDPQSLAAAKDPQKANLEASSGGLFSKVSLALSQKNQQTTAITWEFEKKKLSTDLAREYKKLSKYPDFALKFIYGIRGFIIELLRGQ